MTFDELHAKYTRGDALTDEELAVLMGCVDRLQCEAQQARNIVGHGLLSYLSVLHGNLMQLYQARHRARR